MTRACRLWILILCILLCKGFFKLHILACYAVLERERRGWGGDGGYRNWYENVCPINLTMRLLCNGQLYFHDIYSSSFSFRLPPPSSCSSMLWFVVVVVAAVVVR